MYCKPHLQVHWVGLDWAVAAPASNRQQAARAATFGRVGAIRALQCTVGDARGPNIPALSSRSPRGWYMAFAPSPMSPMSPGRHQWLNVLCFFGQNALSKTTMTKIWACEMTQRNHACRLAILQWRASASTNVAGCNVYNLFMGMKGRESSSEYATIKK